MRGTMVYGESKLVPEGPVAPLTLLLKRIGRCFVLLHGTNSQSGSALKRRCLPPLTGTRRGTTTTRQERPSTTGSVNPPTAGAEFQLQPLMTMACGFRIVPWVLAPQGLLAQRETRGMQGWLLQGLAVGWVLSGPEGSSCRSAIVCSHFKTAQSSIPVTAKAGTGRRGFKEWNSSTQTLGIWVKFPFLTAESRAHCRPVLRASSKGRLGPEALRTSRAAAECDRGVGMPA